MTTFVDEALSFRARKGYVYLCLLQTLALLPGAVQAAECPSALSTAQSLFTVDHDFVFGGPDGSQDAVDP